MLTPLASLENSDTQGSHMLFAQRCNEAAMTDPSVPWLCGDRHFNLSRCRSVHLSLKSRQQQSLRQPRSSSCSCIKFSIPCISITDVSTASMSGAYSRSVRSPSKREVNALNYRSCLHFYTCSTRSRSGGIWHAAVSREFN